MSGPDADPAPLRPGVVWAVASLALLMNTLDASIFNVALPTIRRDLGANISELQWVVDAYTLALAALLLSAGTAGDRFGHRRAAAAGMAVFVAASAACGAAPGAGLLVAARAAQGVGAALLMASTLSLLTVAFPDQRRRARAIGWWAVFSGVGFSAGPPVGGVLVTYLGWRSVFLVNVVPGLACLALLRTGVGETPRAHAHPIDWRGQALACIGLGSAMFGIIEGPADGWTSPAVVSALAVAAVAAVASVRTELALPAPMVELRLFDRNSVRSGALAALAYPFGFLGMLFVLNLYLQVAQGRTPLAVGALFLPMSTAVFAIGPLAGRITARRGPRLPLATGLALQATGALLLLGAGPATPYGELVPSFVLLGAGSSLAATPAIAIVLGATPDRAGMGSGLVNALRQLGAACGVAVLGSIAGPPGAAGFVGRLHVAAVLAAAAPALAAVAALSVRQRQPVGAGR